jgi:UvrD-like helicase C-terminal domain
MRSLSKSAHHRTVRREWSKQQEQALRKIERWRRNPERQLFRLFETLVCLHNNYSVSEPMFNGSLWQIVNLQQFDFGVHKAQGSEGSSVMLVGDSRHFRTDSRRWLYTGITRAVDRLIVVDCS